jgi:FSR family fosmidomycin resistance protein-like MFS transporter
MKLAPSILLPLLFAAATHFLVDMVAGMLNPLWPRLDAHYSLAAWEGAGLFFLWQMTTSVSQFWFGMYGDRFSARWLLAAGPLAAILCLGSIGLTSSPVVLGVLLTVAGLGIAAYHPEAAALAGGCAPEHRSRAMSIFIMGGFLGQAIGPVCSGSLVDALGLAGMSWSIVGGLIIAALIMPLGLGAMRQPLAPRRQAKSLREVIQGRTAPLILVLIIGSLRIIPAAGVPVLLGFLLLTRNANAQETGLVQSAFMFGIGLGGLTCATLVRRHHERLILWLCPLVVCPVLLVVPWTTGIPLLFAVCLAGILLGISLPVMISYGQQLMPDSQRIASSITMGVSWGVGGGMVSVILAVCKYAGRYEGAFAVFALATAISSLLCAWLPATTPAVAARNEDPTATELPAADLVSPL